MAPAPDVLAPAGSSSYSSNSLTVGDGTWDSTRNTFLLPNLMGLNFDTMQYNGMGNRFASLDEYHQLILGHGILAAMVFLFIIPASVMIRRFRVRDGFWTDRFHVYLNILAMFMVTIVFILGVMAVGPDRGLTNPHHGIGVAIFVLMLIQVIGGSWVRGRLRKRVIRGLPIKLMLHQWIGRAIALLGIVQIPLGLTLYGSPKSLFVLYTLWMTFLLLLYFILTHRSARDYEYSRHGHSTHGGTVIEERKSGGIGRWLAPLAAGGALAAFLSRRRSKRESGESRPTEVISSRRGSRRDSGSLVEVEEEKYTEERRRRGGFMDKLLAGGAVLGAGALAKSWWDRRRRDREDEEYSAVAPDTPSARRHRPRRDDVSEFSEESTHVRRDRRDDRHGPILPGPGDPLAAATAISAAQSRPLSRPVTPQPAGRVGGRNRRDSWSSYDSRESPSRRDDRPDHTARNTILGAVGLGWLAKRYKDRRDRQEQDRLDRIREQEAEDERRLEADRRRGNVPPKYTGDGVLPGRRHNGRATEMSESDISTDLTSSYVEPRRGGNMPPLAAGALAGAAGPSGATIPQSRSRHEIIEPVPVPPMEPRRFGESASRIHSPSRGREAEAAVAGAALGAGAAALVEEERRRRELSRSQQSVGSPPVSVKVKVHGDRDRNVTLRRLTEEEAAAERSARRDQSRRRRAESQSSLSGTDVASNRRRYRRDESARRDAAEAGLEAGGARTPLTPPRPAFAAGRPPKDSSYFSGAPPPPPPPPPESLGTPESHATWSGVSPSGPSTAGGDPADRRRRRRLERSQRQASTVDYN